MNAFFNIKKIIRLILSQDSSWLFWDFHHSLRFKLKIPVTRLKYQEAQCLAVIAHICIDGLAVISLGWCAGCVVWEILTSQLTPSLSASPPACLLLHPPSISPALLSSLICSSPADLPPSLKSLWISENIPRSAAMDELILTLCCCIGGQVSVWDTCSFCPNTLSLQAYDRFIKYYTSVTKSISPNNNNNNDNKNTISPVSEEVFDEKTFLFSAAEEKGRDFVSVTANWLKLGGFYLSKYLVAHTPEYSQRSDVRQSKQDGPFLLITVLIVIDLLSSLQTEVQEYFYHFTVKELRSSDCSGSAGAIRWFVFP